MDVIAKMKPIVQRIYFVLLPIVLSCPLLLTACSLAGQTQPVQLPEDLPTTWSTDIKVDDLPLAAGLIDLIGEEQLLRQLIEEAMENNPNLKATALRLKAAGYMLADPRSRLWPEITADFSRGRNNQKEDEETGELVNANTHRLSLGVSWELDIWGRLANECTASEQAVLCAEV